MRIKHLSVGRRPGVRVLIRAPAATHGHMVVFIVLPFIVERPAERGARLEGFLSSISGCRTLGTWLENISTCLMHCDSSDNMPGSALTV
jgi:hypothetical protein